jgi:phenylalanyl-tRNA synthetase beta chain
MRVPYAWLRSYCDPGTDAEEAARRLTMAGTELERIEPVGVPRADGFVVARVVSAEPHPNADRLRVCTVDDGERERTIVCGAPNVAAGQLVALARPGALLADGTALEQAELRGVVSEGMILAEDEVGVGPAHDGTMVLDPALEPGAPLVDHLQIADTALEFEINPNRPDCMAVYGIARELHALTGSPLAEDPTAPDAEASGSDSVDDHGSIEVDPAICLRFTARAYEDVRVGESPLWLKQRLIAAGQRPISNVVDITNYVMLACGQPLHAFDLDRVPGGRIVVRRARDGESMTTLDGVERSLTSEMALVCGGDEPHGIAGIMGGQVSEVSAGTTRVLMEVATWVGPNILQTSKRLALRSDASARFERQLHPDAALAAQRLAARLMVELTGARLVPGTIDVYPEPVPAAVVELRLERLERLLGERIESDDAVAILGRLGFGVEQGDGSIRAGVPYWRNGDVQREVDLIEEVARVHGLERLPATLPARRRAVGRLTRDQRLRRRAEDLLRDRGLSEAISYSFTSRAALERLGRGEREGWLAIDNPLSEEQSVMRPTLLPGLLDALARNAAHDRPHLALFESGRVYEPAEAGEAGPADGSSPAGATPARERRSLAAALTALDAGGWRSQRRAADFYAAKALVEALAQAFGVALQFAPAEEPHAHPGRSAAVLCGLDPSGGVAEMLGWVGELHPLVIREWDLPGPVAAFELDLDAICEAAPTPAPFATISEFPPVLQDIAVVVPEDAHAARVTAVVRGAAGPLLREARIFDVYSGEQLEAGRKSLALRLEFRADDRTLDEAEVAARRAAIEAALAEIGGSLRA